MIRNLLITGFAATAAACSTSHRCNSGVAVPFFDGFDSTTLERVVVTHNGPYPDTVVYLLSAYKYPLEHSDTNANIVHWPYQYRFYMHAGDDLEIQIASTGKKYQINNLTETSGTVKQSFMGNDEECWDVITGYSLDGKYYNTGLTEPDYAGSNDVQIVIRP